jgi:hypothetical protein
MIFDEFQVSNWGFDRRKDIMTHVMITASANMELILNWTMLTQSSDAVQKQ